LGKEKSFTTVAPVINGIKLSFSTLLLHQNKREYLYLTIFFKLVEDFQVRQGAYPLREASDGAPFW
jgi:hypothetical protein